MNTASDPTAERKQALRAEMQALRARLAGERERASAAVADIARPLILENGAGRCVAGYMALAEEMDPLPLMKRLAEAGVDLALPVVEGAGLPLVFRRWRPDDPLRTGPFGIACPLDTAPLAEPDWLLVPLLAFDRCGHRLGFGGGYYDRTLARLRAHASRPVRALGLAFAAQQLDSLPVGAYDEPLDLIVTEREVLRPVRPAGHEAEAKGG